MTAIYLIAGAALCVWGVVNLSGMRKYAQLGDLKHFPLWAQRIVLLVLGAVFIIPMAALCVADAKKYEQICLYLFIAETVSLILYNAVLTVIYKNHDVEMLMRKIYELKLDIYAEPSAIRSELKNIDGVEYSLQDIRSALNKMRK